MVAMLSSCSRRWPTTTATCFDHDTPLELFGGFEPVGFLGGDTNLTRSVGNDPANIVDPSGLAGAPVGHHYVNVATIQAAYKEGRISRTAYYIAMGFYSGATDPAHKFGTYGAITHADYNKAIKTLLKKELTTLGSCPSKPMSGRQMLDFINNNVVGQKASAEIESFNKSVIAQAKQFRSQNPASPIPGTSKKELIAQGMKFVENNGPRLAKLGAALAAMSGASNDVFGAFAEFVKKDSEVRKEFDNAVAALGRGDINAVNFHIVGNGPLDGMAGALVMKGYDKSAANLRRQWNEMMYQARLEQYQDQADLVLCSEDEEGEEEPMAETPAVVEEGAPVENVLAPISPEEATANGIPFPTR